MKQLSCNWASALNLTIYEMNTTVSTVTGQTPYEMVFGQYARTRCHELDLLAQRGILNEEEITGGLFQEDPDIITKRKKKQISVWLTIKQKTWTDGQIFFPSYKCHVLVMDIDYCNVFLFAHLDIEQQTLACGTAQTTRRFFTQDLVSREKVQQGES